MTCDIYSSGRRGGERRARAVNQVSNMYRKKKKISVLRRRLTSSLFRRGREGREDHKYC